ncbi:HAD-IB family hydrolase [Salipaludibacillus neizhouensis]|uniref:HAD-IB family hydrolase n=1 Tax=Salipaludibacillus neizhouensis TaxID=885475 RepID=A0A3A9K238_9BACI|nr:HAD family hydrolase [Salipaludibacillus neizhouensis]RKL67204.1 HAD-IB family hydrolase [Salipaludibacillus neizhouensis]
MAIVTVDFDGTLYQGNSFKAMFLVAEKEFTWKEWLLVSGGMVKAVGLGVWKGKQAFRHTFFKAFAKSFKGKTKQELDEFFNHLVLAGSHEVHQDLVHTIREHQSKGDQVIILSGALTPFLEAFIRELQLDVPVISTEILFDDQGYCTGEIGTIVNGQEKVRKIVDWIGEKMSHDETSRSDGDNLWAYADSESDLPLLEFVNKPVVVNPNSTMKQIAEKNQWPVF